MSELLVPASQIQKGKGEEEWMSDWQSWAIVASWFLALFFRIERIYDSVKEIKRDLAKQVYIPQDQKEGEGNVD